MKLKAKDPDRAAEPPPHETPVHGAPVRPRGLVVTGPGAGRSRLDLVDETLDWEVVSAESAVEWVRRRPSQVLLLDGGLDPTSLRALLGPLRELPFTERPAVLVVTPTGGRDGFEDLLDGHGDDVVNGSLGAGELRARVGAALRARGYLDELSRKNAELEGLYAKVDVMARRMAEELRLATNVQRCLTPPPLQHPRLEVAREFIPFREIGGDFYDLVALSPNRLAFAIGDVMGKGVPAALLAASLKACLRARLLSPEVAIDRLVSAVNQVFWEVSPAGLFATLFFSVFDLDRGVLDYVNAGHHYPFLVTPHGGIHDLVEGGTVLGIGESAQYSQGTISIARDDLLVFYSDGVTDRLGPGGEPFGVERLKAAALRSRGDDARIALYTLLGEAQGWSSGAPPEDDMTLVVTRVR
jgi:serine phosphatase RsbU (regulator of sigma subunit)